MVLRYRMEGLTQEEIAYILHTTSENVCETEAVAKKNIQRAMNTLDFYCTLDARYLCTLMAGADVFDAISCIFAEAGKIGETVNTDPVDLLNRLREESPRYIHGGHLMQCIKVYLQDDGEIRFGWSYPGDLRTGDERDTSLPSPDDRVSDMPAHILRDPFPDPSG